MKKSRMISIMLAFYLIYVPKMANAALVGRLPATPGGTDYQAYYDTTLDITWVRDGSLVKSNTFGLPTGVSLGMHPSDHGAYSGTINANGTMNWTGALHWIDAMNGANFLGFNDWRLPTIVDTGDFGCDWSEIGSTDCGYFVQTGSAATTVYSEMASLYYDTFGNIAFFSEQPGSTGPFINVIPFNYWSGLPLVTSLNSAWSFDFGLGRQGNFHKESSFSAIVVRNGDVSPVPLPAAVWLLCSGILGLLRLKRFRKER